MNGRTWIGRRPVVTVLALAALAMAGPTSAQEDERSDCTCVDREGNELENCVCFHRPEIDDLGFGLFRMARAHIGVAVEEGPDGAVVTEVVEGSPADQAGLRVGDVITAVDGSVLLEPLDDRRAELRIDEDDDVAVERLMTLARRWDPGDDVRLEVLRDGQAMSFDLEAERAPNDFRALSGSRFGSGGDHGVGWRLVEPGRTFRFWHDSLRSELRDVEPHVFSFGDGLDDDAFRNLVVVGGNDPCVELEGGWIAMGRDCVDGVRFVALNPELGTYFGTEEGVLVADVSETSTLGLRPGDVLLAVDGREVDDAAHARQILRSYRDDEPVTLRVRRQGREIDVEGTRR